jgi:hypothetical protein
VQENTFKPGITRVRQRDGSRYKRGTYQEIGHPGGFGAVVLWDGDPLATDVRPHHLEIIPEGQDNDDADDLLIDENPTPM